MKEFYEKIRYRNFEDFFPEKDRSLLLARIDDTLYLKTDDGLDEVLADYINQHITDDGWKRLIVEVKNLETNCKAVLADKFVHISWPFMAGVSQYPIKSYQMAKLIAELGKDQN